MCLVCLRGLGLGVVSNVAGSLVDDIELDMDEIEGAWRLRFATEWLKTGSTEGKSSSLTEGKGIETAWEDRARTDLRQTAGRMMSITVEQRGGDTYGRIGPNSEGFLWRGTYERPCGMYFTKR